MNQIMRVPVVLIIYKRPRETSLVLQQIIQMKPPKLYVIADGPKQSNGEETELIKQTRSLFEKLPDDIKVVKIFSEFNKGLRENVVQGLTQVFSSETEALILEDDCLPSLQFYDFVVALLRRYQGNPKIGMISGNNFASMQSASPDSYYFSNHPHIWGWATRSDVWNQFTQWLQSSDRGREFKEIKNHVQSRSKRKFLAKMFKNRTKLDSWALDFTYFFYSKELLSIVPGQNLVTNIGFGSNSTHTKFESFVDEVPLGVITFPLHHPNQVCVNKELIKREARTRLWKWIWFPIIHPFSFAGRAFRYLGVLMRDNALKK